MKLVNSRLLRGPAISCWIGRVSVPTPCSCSPAALCVGSAFPALPSLSPAVPAPEREGEERKPTLITTCQERWAKGTNPHSEDVGCFNVLRTSPFEFLCCNSVTSIKISKFGYVYDHFVSTAMLAALWGRTKAGLGWCFDLNAIVGMLTCLWWQRKQLACCIWRRLPRPLP